MDTSLVVLAIPDGYPPVNFLVTLNGEGGELEPIPQDEVETPDPDSGRVTGSNRKKGAKSHRRSMRPWNRAEAQVQEEEQDQSGSSTAQTQDGTLELLAKQGFSLYGNRNREPLMGLPEPYPSDYDITRWGRATQAHMRRRGYLVSREALRYWVRYFFDPSHERDRWNYVCGRIDQLF